MKVEVYVDGFCEPNPGLGGWGWFCPTLNSHDCGGENPSTNNRMEIEAIRQALVALDVADLTVYSDSQLAIGILSKGWKASKNLDIVNATKELLKKPGRAVTFQWVRGHTGNPGNEKADQLAKQGSMGRVVTNESTSSSSQPRLL